MLFWILLFSEAGLTMHVCIFASCAERIQGISGIYEHFNFVFPKSLQIDSVRTFRKFI